jgi:hypothetical protein
MDGHWMAAKVLEAGLHTHEDAGDQVDIHACLVMIATLLRRSRRRQYRARPGDRGDGPHLGDGLGDVDGDHPKY